MVAQYGTSQNFKDMPNSVGEMRVSPMIQMKTGRWAMSIIYSSLSAIFLWRTQRDFQLQG